MVFKFIRYRQITLYKVFLLLNKTISTRFGAFCWIFLWNFFFEISWWTPEVPLFPIELKNRHQMIKFLKDLNSDAISFTKAANYHISVKSSRSIQLHYSTLTNLFNFWRCWSICLIYMHSMPRTTVSLLYYKLFVLSWTFLYSIHLQASCSIIFINKFLFWGKQLFTNNLLPYGKKPLNI